jgi:hypothetical protein
MLTYTKTFSSFSVPERDLGIVREFYKDTLGLDVRETLEGLQIIFNDGNSVFIYPADHAAALYTVLNFVVENIDATIDDLVGRGVAMEQYDLPGIKTDAKGVCRNEDATGPKALAWFKDPSGHIISVIQE